MSDSDLSVGVQCLQLASLLYNQSIGAVAFPSKKPLPDLVLFDQTRVLHHKQRLRMQFESN